MIRVNLLPIKQARRRSAGRAQLLVFAALIVAEIAVLGLLYVTESSQLDKLNQKVAESKQEVEQIKSDVQDAQELENQKQQLTQQLSVLAELEAQRSGPVKVLDELQAMLSPPRNEQDRFAQLQKNWNVDWDTRRLWVDSMSETSGSFTLQGGAVNADDVAEFLQRLSTGSHFQEVELDIVQATGTTQTVTFSIFGKLNYSGVPAQPGQGT